MAQLEGLAPAMADLAEEKVKGLIKEGIAAGVPATGQRRTTADGRQHRTLDGSRPRRQGAR